MANNFNYFTPTKVVFGADTEKETGKLIKELGYRKVLLHFGGKSAVDSGLLGRIKTALEETGLEYIELGGVVPNPHLELVYNGIEMCKKDKVDFILAVGGGSVIDSAKAIAYGCCYDGDVWDYFSRRSVPVAALPIGVVLTIAAAGSEMSASCVITKDSEKRKRSVASDMARPKFAIMNPDLTKTLPDYQSMAGCVDIMMHTMERYFTGKGNMEITDKMAEALLKTLIHNTHIIHEKPDDYDARAEIMWAGSLSHNGLLSCGNGGDDFVTHGIEHELSGMFDVTHGAGLAAVWGSWARYVMNDIMDRFVSFAVNVMGIEEGSKPEETALAGIEAMEAFYKSINMPISIRELGVEPTDEQMHIMAKNYADCCGPNGGKGSARMIKEEDAYKIYKMAF